MCERSQHRAKPLSAVRRASEGYCLGGVEDNENVSSAWIGVPWAWAIGAEDTEIVRPSGAHNMGPFEPWVEQTRRRAVESSRKIFEVFPREWCAVAFDETLSKGEIAPRPKGMHVRRARNGAVLQRACVMERPSHCQSAVMRVRRNSGVTQSDQCKVAYARPRRTNNGIERAREKCGGWRRRLWRGWGWRCSWGWRGSWGVRWLRWRWK